MGCSTALEALLQDNATHVVVLERVAMTLGSCAAHHDTAHLQAFLEKTLGMAEQPSGQQVSTHYNSHLANA